MDKTSLEDAIRNEAEQQILSIARKEAGEIKALDDAYATEIDNFKKSIQAQTDERIKLETSRVENRANLDLKKLKIRSIESLISRAVEEAVKTIRDNPLYKKFLLDAITVAVGQIPGKAEIRLDAGDMGLEKEIREALKAAGVSDGDVVFREDGKIRWGGCAVVDVSGGRVFDSTIERIYFRKSLLIRQEAVGLLGESSGEEFKETSCRIQ